MLRVTAATICLAISGCAGPALERAGDPHPMTADEDRFHIVASARAPLRVPEDIQVRFESDGRWYSRRARPVQAAPVEAEIGVWSWAPGDEFAGARQLEIRFALPSMADTGESCEYVVSRTVWPRPPGAFREVRIEMSHPALEISRSCLLLQLATSVSATRRTSTRFAALASLPRR